MTDWNPLLDPLTSGPRENGTPALEDTVQLLIAVARRLDR